MPGLNGALTTSGPGISQAYNGRLVANALGLDVVNVQVPFWDYANNQIAFRTVLFQTMSDGTGGGNDLIKFLELLWQDVQQDFWIARQPDLNLSVTVLIDQIYQEFAINNTPFCALSVIDIQPQPNGWYNTSNPVFAKYGFMKPRYRGYYVKEPKWINESSAWYDLGDIVDTCAFQFVGSSVLGIATFFGKLLPPSLVYTGVYSGSYPT